MTRYLIIVICMLTAAIAKCQTVNLSPASFNQIETWSQSQQNFICNSDGYLRDTSRFTDFDVIYRTNEKLYPEAGTIDIKLNILCKNDLGEDFRNSTLNNFRIYIFANGSDPTSEDFRGISIGTGYSGNTDKISLAYHIGDREIIFAKTPIPTSKENNLALHRTAAGKWTIHKTNSQTYAEFSTEYQEPKLGFICADYTVVSFQHNTSGAGKFAIRLEEFKQQKYTIKRVSTIDSAKIINSHTIRIFQNARLDESTATNTQNYTLNGQNPQKASYQFYHTDLTFADELPAGKALVVKTQNLKDVYGVDVNDFSATLTQAAPGQIVINEIMVDLSPEPFGLPKAKYVELYNCASLDFRLEDYYFWIDDTEYYLPDTHLGSGEYLIICSNPELFAKYGATAEAIQENRLTVSGKRLSITNKLGGLVDSVTYSDKLYNDPLLKEGGHSMERIDPDNNCGGAQNWKVSQDISGGTPGRENSVHQVFIDETTPELQTLQILSPSKFQLTFSEPISEINISLNKRQPSYIQIDNQTATATFAHQLTKGENSISGSVSDKCQTSSDLSIKIDYTEFKATGAYAVSSYQVAATFSINLNELNVNNFSLDNGAIPILCEYTSAGKNTIILTFADDFESNRKYRLRIKDLTNAINDTIKDCELKFSYHSIDNQDVLINEVLFYPQPKAKRFVEIVNNSQEDIFVHGLRIRFYSADLQTIKEGIVDEFRILGPGDYLAITADSAALRDTYKDYKTGNILQCKKFPTLNTSKGYISLISSDGKLLDSMYYDNKMHLKLLSDTRGVSLERVSVNKGSLDQENWRSSSAEFGFATPGFRNSCQEDFSENDVSSEDSPTPGDTGNTRNDKEITIENQLFTPNDSDKEYTMIFDFDEAETMVSIMVFDDNGRKVRNLVSQNPTYPGCRISWNGLDNSGSRCRTGMYIVLIRAYSSTGWTKEYKKVAVIGRR
ncbi:MAG: lamin tail domain-containing protein [Bacteroidales bacterium]|nr:lamin tail domain-containing protein [Bacteroidales bacterium]